MRVVRALAHVIGSVGWGVGVWGLAGLVPGACVFVGGAVAWV